MRTILIYSGQTRGFRHVWANHAFFLWRQFSHLTIIASVADDENAADIELVGRSGVPYAIERVTQPEIQEPVDSCAFHSATPRESSIRGILRQFWALNRAWEFANERVGIAATDVVIRCRPDLAFSRLEAPIFEPRRGPLCLTPWWGRWGGVNDRFAILDGATAAVYFTLFPQRDLVFSDYCPVHPETMLNHHLRLHDIAPSHDLAAEFICVRTDGAFRPVDASVIDVAEYARKGHG